MRLIALILGCQLFLAASAPGAAEGVGSKGSAADLSGELNAVRHTNIAALVGDPHDPTIVRFVAQILRRQHYLRLPINDEVSSKFLDRYFDSLDNLHIYFLQSDIQEFEKYRYQLDDLTVEEGDITPGRVIFTRFRERVNQQYEYVQELLRAAPASSNGVIRATLKGDSLEVREEDAAVPERRKGFRASDPGVASAFDFTGTDRIVIDRKKMPRPRDLKEAKGLWRDRLRYEYLQEKLNHVKPEEIVKNLNRRYTRVLRMINEYDNDDVMQIYLTALTHVYDPHSDYMGRAELENFSIGMKLSLYGIGALLQSEDGICKIKSLTDGGPAQHSKQLKPDDKIIAVAQSNQPPVDVVDMKLNKVVELIRGPKGTEVRLTIIPADAPNATVRKVVTLIRNEIKLEDSAAKARLFEVPAPNGSQEPLRLGVIDLPSFYSGFDLDGKGNGGEQKSTTTDVAKLIQKLLQEKVSGIVLDLRRNGGGSLEEAISLTGLFIKEGPVVQVKDYDSRIFRDNDPDDSVLYDGPLIVLTSRFSASASEILAGALQDYGRALIVGDSSTHGKGTVQSLLQLKPIMRQSGVLMTNDPGALKVTIRKFYRASGASTQLKGVTPDIILPSVNNHIEVGEASLENPLEWDTIPAASYDKLNRVEPYLAALRKSSEKRIATDPDFVYVREEIERFKKAQAEKSISLNEEVRLKEKKEADDRSKARKKSLASRAEPAGKVYDLSLKLADQPGLPPPTLRTNLSASAKTNETGRSDGGGKLSGSPGRTAEESKPGSSKAAAAKAAAEKPGHGTSDDDGDDLADTDVQPVDIGLDETRRILIDYARMLNAGRGVASTQPESKPGRGKGR